MNIDRTSVEGTAAASDPRRVTLASPPPVSRRHDPRFTDPARKQQLAAAFLSQGTEYDDLRPGYPDVIVDQVLAAASRDSGQRGRLRVVDMGAGSGKLSLAFVGRGCAVTAVDPSAQMLLVAKAAGPKTRDNTTRAAVGPHALGGTLTTRVASAEDTGLASGCADLVTAAQAWHWFDPAAATAEALRLLDPEGPGMLALVWNTLDVSIPWVHRYSRIAHAGDVQRDGFRPAIGEGMRLEARHVHRWVDPRTTLEAIDLAKTRSYYGAAPAERRAKVLDNLDWYLHEHLGHEEGSVIELPYRTDLFLYSRQ